MNRLKGILLSIVISLSISYFTIMIIAFTSDGLRWSGDGLFREFSLAFILGILIGFENLLFTIESWSYRRIFATHYVLIMVTAFIIGAIGGWFEPSEPTAYMRFFLQATFVYMTITAFFSITQKKEIEQLNKILNESRGNSDDLRD